MSSILLLVLAVLIPIAVHANDNERCDIIKLSVQAYTSLYEFNNNIEKFVSS